MSTTIKFIIAILLSLFVLPAIADTPPNGAVRAWMFDSGGNTLSSTTGWLDVYVANSPAVTFTSTVEMPIYSELVFGGVAIDPRTRSWSLLNSTDSVTAYQGGTWNDNVTGTVTANIGTTGGLGLDTSLQTLIGKFTDTANGLKVEGSAVTQPVSASSLPLPTGAATDAHLTNVQSAPGTSATTAQTIQGSASGVPVPVSGTLTTTPSGTQNVNVTQVNGSTVSTAASGTQKVGIVGNTGSALDSAAGTSNGQVLSVQGNASGVALPVSASSLPLPTGASTATNQTNVQSTPGTSAATAVTVQGSSSGVALPVSASSLPLPIGAATSANQTNGSQITQVSSLPSIPSGSNNIGSITNVTGTVTLPTGAATSANQTNGNQITQVSSLPSIPSGSNNIGSITNVTGTVSLPTGASTAANQTTGNTSLSSINANQTNGTQISQLPPSVTPATQNITAADTSVSSVVGANNQKFYTGTPTTNSSAVFALSNWQAGRLEVTGSFIGTLQIEISWDSGSLSTDNFYTQGVKQAGTSQETSSFTCSSSGGCNFAGDFNASGLTYIRVRATSYTSGTATVQLTQTSQTNAIHVTSQTASQDKQGSGTITSTTPVSIGTNGSATMTLTVSGTWSASIELLGGQLLGATTGPQLWFRQVPGDDTNVITANGTYCIDTAGFPAIVIDPAIFTSGTVTYQYDVGQQANKSCGNGVQAVSLGNSNKTVTMKTGNISTTATTANQVIVTYTVPAGVTFYLEYFRCTANTEAAAVTATAFGSCQLQIGGTNVYQDWLHGDGENGYSIGESVGEPIPVPAGTVIQWTTTPFATTAFFWYANFGGYYR